MGRSNTKARTKRPAKVSDDVLLAEIAVKHTWAKSFRALITLVGLAIVVLATWPAAHELSGESTELNITMALGITVSLTLAGAGAAVWGDHHRRRANRLQVRNEALSRDVKELQQRLRDNALPEAVTRG